MGSSSVGHCSGIGTIEFIGNSRLILFPTTHNQAFNADSLQRGICFANFTPRCKSLRRQAGSVLPVNLALDFIQSMALFRDITTWRLGATDLLYKDPFSDITHSHRRRTVFTAVVVILNTHYPIDLSESKVLGIVFESGSDPPLTAILALTLLFLTAVWVTYSVQELVAWWAQGRESMLLDFESKLDKLSKNDIDIVQELQKTSEWLRELQTALERINSPSTEFESTYTERVKKAADEGVRFGNWHV